MRPCNLLVLKGSRWLKITYLRLAAVAIFGIVCIGVVGVVADNQKLVTGSIIFLLGLCGFLILTLKAGIGRLVSFNREQDKETRRTHKSLEDRLSRDFHTIRWRLDALPGTLLTETQAMTQLQNKYPSRESLPPVGGWALNPTELLLLTEKITEQRPRLVVECGSGTSTFWIANTLKSLGAGRVVALDHLEEHVTRSRAVIESHGLQEWAEVVYAPLVDHNIGGNHFSWYDISGQDLHGLDFLIVDGPPTSSGKHARYPAIPMLRPYFADFATVLVDDTTRIDEQEVLGLWLEDDSELEVVGSGGLSSKVLEYKKAR